MKQESHSRGGTSPRDKTDGTKHEGAGPRAAFRGEPLSARAGLVIGQPCSTSAARTVSSIDASLTNPACKRSSCASDMASRSTPGVASGERTLCSHLSRISAARGSETALSLRPRSISASEGGSRSRRLARCFPGWDRKRGTPAFRGCRPPCRSSSRAGFSNDRPPAVLAGGRSGIALFMRDREGRGDRKVTRSGLRKHPSA